MIDGFPQIPPEIETAAQSALPTLSAALKARPGDADRAMGMYLQVVSAYTAASWDWRLAHGECAQDDTACQSAAAEAVKSAASESVRALARLATTTSDPDAYALALYACRPIGGASSPDCALLNHAQWARIEPDNAIPWLYLAREAEQRSDRSTFEAAVVRASKSRYSDPHWDQISQVFISDGFEAQPSPVQVQLAVVLVGFQAALGIPGPPGLPQYCSNLDPASSRFETCVNLAAMFVEHGRTWLDVFQGGKITERIGSNDPRVSALREQADAITWQSSQQQKSELKEIQSTFGSCDWLQRVRDNVASGALLGETGVLRQKLADAGITVSQAAQRRRAELQQRPLEAK